MPKLTGDQLDVLEKNFKQNRNPNDFELALISAEAGMSENDVKVCVSFYIKPGKHKEKNRKRHVLPMKWTLVYKMELHSK